MRQAIILAGGKGTRLRPYTVSLPKPLMPVGDYPILEIMILQLARSGFSRIILAVNHQAELIKAYFGNGSRFGIEILYSLEKKPLGTVGPLGFIYDLDKNFLVMNGDILTDLNFEKLLQLHESKKNLLTVSTYRRSTKIDYGVLDLSSDNNVIGFREKPVLDFNVSMGIYVMNKKILKHIPKDKFGFDDLILRLLAKNEKVAVNVYDGYWMDIGRPEDFFSANEDFETMRGKFLID